MKIWKKIISGFLVVVLIMLSVGILSLFHNTQLIKTFKDLEYSKKVELTQSNSISYNSLKIRLELRELFLKKGDNEEIQRAKYSIENQFLTLYKSLEELHKATALSMYGADNEDDIIGEVDEIALIDSLEMMISRLSITVHYIFKLQADGKYKEAESLFEVNALDISKKIQATVNTLIKDAENEVDLALMQMDIKLKELKITSVYITFFCCAIAIGIGYFISRLITKALRKITHSANEVRKGNLDVRVELDTKDELKILADSFNEMTRELQAKIIAIENLNKELLAANNTKDTLFSIVAHDLKNPFNSILGFSNLLSNRYDDYDDDKRKMFIKEIEKSSNSTYELLENLLTWARSQSGKIHINKENIKLINIIEESINSYSTNATQKRIDILTNVSNSVMVNADRYTLSIVINNILSNAIKFSPIGGQVTISAQSFADHVDISIKDTGIGMSQKVITNLFLSKDHKSTLGTNYEKGTGFGLILVKDFIKANDGQLWIESEIGVGSEFRFSLKIGCNSFS